MLTPLVICYVFICLLNAFYDNTKFIWLVFATFLLIPVEYKDVVSYLLWEYILQIICFLMISIMLLLSKGYIRASVFCFAAIISCFYLYLTLFTSDYTLIVYWIKDYIYLEFLLVLVLSPREWKDILYYALVIMLLFIGHTILTNKIALRLLV